MSVCLTHYPLRSAIKVEGESLDEGVKGNEMNGALTPASGGTREHPTLPSPLISVSHGCTPSLVGRLNSD